MRKLLLWSAISLATIITPTLADVAVENSAQVGLSGSKYSGITDGLDMQGGGVTSIEMLADKVIEEIQSRWAIQRDVLHQLRIALRDPIFRDTATKLGYYSPKDYTSTYNLIIAHMNNPVVMAAFEQYGTLQGIVELAYSIEIVKFGRILAINASPVNVNAAILKLWHAATSPLEEKLKYSASYRYGID